jgi:hypothetical protein
MCNRLKQLLVEIVVSGYKPPTHTRGKHTQLQRTGMDWPLALTMLSKLAVPWPCNGGPGFWTNKKREEDDLDGKSR